MHDIDDEMTQEVLTIPVRSSMFGSSHSNLSALLCLNLTLIVQLYSWMIALGYQYHIINVLKTPKPSIIFLHICRILLNHKMMLKDVGQVSDLGIITLSS